MIGFHKTRRSRRFMKIVQKYIDLLSRKDLQTLLSKVESEAMLQPMLSLMMSSLSFLNVPQMTLSCPHVRGGLPIGGDTGSPHDPPLVGARIHAWWGGTALCSPQRGRPGTWCLMDRTRRWSRCRSESVIYQSLVSGKWNISLRCNRKIKSM